jgi:hypothetical protein
MFEVMGLENGHSTRKLGANPSLVMAEFVA